MLDDVPLGINAGGSPSSSEVDPDALSVTASIVTAIHVPPPDSISDFNSNGEALTPSGERGGSGGGGGFIGFGGKTVDADSVSQLSDQSLSSTILLGSTGCKDDLGGGGGSTEGSVVVGGGGAGATASSTMIDPSAVDDESNKDANVACDSVDDSAVVTVVVPRQITTNAASTAESTAAAAAPVAASASEAFSWEKTSPEGRTAQEPLDKSRILCNNISRDILERLFDTILSLEMN